MIAITAQISTSACHQIENETLLISWMSRTIRFQRKTEAHVRFDVKGSAIAPLSLEI
jgi:hypothetical protein